MAFPQFEVLNTTVEMDIAQAISTARNAIHLAVTDTATSASGYHTGFYVAYTATGDKTGSSEIQAFMVDLVLTGANTPYAYIESLYLAASGNPTIGLASAISIYIDDLGTGVASLHVLDLQSAIPTASAPTTRQAWIRVRNHGTGSPTSVFFLQANNNAKAATNFIEQDSVTVGPVVASTTAITSGTNTTYRVQCLHGTTTFYLLGVAAS